MRVIAGQARSLKLKTPPGDDVRPTTDRIKETLFNMLAPRIYGCDFLDMFAGSGAIGIEALSRGADSAVFVESARVSLACIEDNLAHTKLEGGYIYKSDAVNSVSRLFHEGKRFDIIFMDPPYNNSLEQKVLEQLAQYDILKEDGLIIVEASAATEFDYLDDLGFEITREKSYGSNKHVFIGRAIK